MRIEKLVRTGLASLLAGLVVGSTLLAATSPVAAQNPSAQDVVNKYIEATGGKEALEKVKTLQVRGKMELASVGLTADLSVLQTQDAFLMTIALPGLGDLVQARNGEVAWASRQDGTIAKLEGKEKQQMMQNARMHEQLSWLDYKGEIIVKGDADIDGTAAWHLRFEPTDGVAADRYFAKESGLLLKVSMTAVSELGEIPTDSYFSDYKEFDGIKMACNMRQVVNVGGVGEMRFIYDDVKVNEEIPEDRFAPPAGIDE